MNKWCIVLVAELALFCGQANAEGLALPRFVSLSKNTVNLRTGPGNKYPIEWVYQERGYPLEVVDEYELWRQVREADGTMGWIHRTQLMDKRHALILEETQLTSKPTANGKIIAIAQKGTVGQISKCPEKSDYCLLIFDGVKGWVNKKMIYGVYPNEVID